MALVRAQEASSSSSRRRPYHVFLSFRGEEIRSNFAARLYTALSDAGFHTFIDDDDDGDGIKRGENSNSDPEKAIEEARGSIIVFSKGYASSIRCLDKLVMIVQRKRRTSPHVILPVFYHVDPSHVRKQRESFAEAFGRHEERIELESNETVKDCLRNRVKEWRAALKEVADLAGIVVGDYGDEFEFIKEIVKEIGKNVNSKTLYVDRYMVGMETRVKNIISWLEHDSDDVGILLIYGTGGIGKTTIAKYIYNNYSNSKRFEACSFLANVREKSKQPNGLVKLQRQLLSDILGRGNKKINSVEEGITRIGDAIGCKKVLVFLDDVDEKDQLKAIIGMRDCFHPKSKIILTTRHQDLSKDYEGYKMHEVERFSEDESLELFSWHAFRQDHPIEGYVDYSKRVVEYCGGIPLALEVLGSFLFGENSKVWESTLKKLDAILDINILKILKISYDTLPDDTIKNMFLYVACFFLGKNKDFMVKILEACDTYPIVGMKILIDRCLLSIDEDNKVVMHQLVRDMGREIVRQESPNEPGKRSRLWHHEDSFKVLKERNGTEKVKGLFLDMHLMGEDRCSNRSFPVRNKKRARFEELGDNSLFANQCNSLKRRSFGFLSWLPINMTVRNSDKQEFKADAFARMQKLRLLQLNYAEIKGGYKDFPKELRWLSWRGFPQESITSDFPVEFLVALDLRYSSLKQLWKGTKMLKSLKILNLSHSHALANSPDFSQLPNLEELILKDCINLVRLHESIGKLGRLVLLNLRGCKNLRQLPKEIFQMKFLEKLILYGCSSLDRLHPDLGKMESLQKLDAHGLNLSLTSLPRRLVTLNLASCNLSSDGIPDSLCTMLSLKELDLRFNPICTLPELPMSLRWLNVSHCRKLKRLANLPNLSTNRSFHCIGCEKLVAVLGLFELAPVGNVDSEMVSMLGLAEPDSPNGVLQVELENEITQLKHKKSSVLQGLYECGIYSIFLHGSEIPSWFDKKSDGASSISFTVPWVHNLKIRSLNVCVVHVYKESSRYFMCDDDYIMVNNETRDQTWVYTPVFSYVTGSNMDEIIWLSDWKIANQVIGIGDKVNVWVERSRWHRVKEFGIRIVYDNNPTICHQNIVNIDWSDYQIGTGEYFLRTETWSRTKQKGLEYWSRQVGSKRATAEAEETEYNSDGDAIEDIKSDIDDYIPRGVPMDYESLGIARCKKKVFLGSSVVIEEITNSEISAIREGTRMED